MTEQILACPYCGIEEGKVFTTSAGKRFYVGSPCGASGPVADNESDAVLFWNAAAKLIDEKDEEIKKLNNMVKYFDEIAQSWQGYAEKIEAERDTLAKVVFSNEGEQ